MLFKKNKEIFVSQLKNNFLVVQNLTKSYKRNTKPAINDISFKVGPGEFHAFIGGNGAGKTTTIKSIVGAYSRYKGEIYICGYLNKSLNAKRSIGYIPEIARFPDGMSVKSYLKNMALLSEVNRSEVDNLVKNILIDLNMQNLANKSPNTFSSGQKKKILLAQALIHNPKILIMDEPAANLDPRSRIEFFNFLKKLQLEGKSIFISSHILDELDKYATHATILDGGKIVFSDSLDEYRNKFEKQIYFTFADNKLALNFLRKNKIKFEFNKDLNVFSIFLKKNTDISKILILLLKNNIDILSFNKKLATLENIYYKYVIKGSVHTMKN